LIFREQLIADDGPHGSKRSLHPCPEPDLAGGLVDEHPETAANRGTVASGLEQERSEHRVVDEVDDELPRPEPARVDASNRDARRL